MKLYEGAEPYENFTFGDKLHVCDDSPDEVQFWVGILPYGAVFETSKWTDADYLAAIVMERPGLADYTLFGWMPADTPYWHRASHCPRKEL